MAATVKRADNGGGSTKGRKRSAISPMEGRMVWLDALRLLAGVSMVLLHSSSDPAGQPFTAYSPVERAFPVLLRSVIYIARTELFIIISLFLLMISLEKRPRPWPLMVREQARRLLVPFAFWVVFYAFYHLYKASAFGYADALWAEMGRAEPWIGYFLLGDVKFHMHFLPTLFGIVLLAPLYRHGVRYPILGLMVLACLLVKRELDIFIWERAWWLPGHDYLLRAVKILTYAGYGFVAAAAWGLMKRGFFGERARPFLPALIYLGITLFSLKLISAFRTIESGKWAFDYTPGYWADFLMPVAVFLIAMALADRHWPPLFSRLAPYSFGLYLVHPIFIDIFEVATRGIEMSPSALVLSKIGFVLPLAALLSWLLGRTPALAWTIGLGPVPRLRRTLPNTQTASENSS